MNESCGGCATRSSHWAGEWHRLNKVPLCERASELTTARNRERARKRAEAEGRTYVPRTKVGGKKPPRWTPGSDIIIEEHDPL